MTRPLLTRPDSLTGDQKALLDQLTSACAEMTSLASLIRSFAALLKPSPGNQARLTDWTQTARTCELPDLHAFTRGPDLAAALPDHNGRT